MSKPPFPARRHLVIACAVCAAAAAVGAQLHWPIASALCAFFAVGLAAEAWRSRN